MNIDKHIVKTVSILLFIFCSMGSRATTADKPYSYYFKQIGINERLSQSRVQAVLSDHKGYLWIGTQSGLNRYDRNMLTQYSDSKEQMLPSNDILFITEDALFNLWVATGKGICLYDRSNDRFTPVLVNDRKLLISSYLLTEQGIMLASNKAIYLYDYATRKINLLQALPEHKQNHYLCKMIRYDKQRILINTGYQVFFFNQKNHTVETVPFLKAETYTTVYMDSEKRLWASKFGGGLCCYKDGVLQREFNTSNSKLTYDVVYDIVEKDNQLWIVTDGGGVNIISLKNYAIDAIQQTQDDLRSLPTNAFFRIYKDPSENIWLGSIRSGLIGVREVYARSYRNVPFGNRYGLSNQTINSFFQDSDGFIWIGTDGGGINRFEPLSGTFVHYPSTQYEKVVSIVEYSSQELLYFSYNKGIFIFNKKNGQKRPFILIDRDTNDRNCISGFSTNILRIAKNKILFSGLNLYIYDMDTRKFSIAHSENTYFINNTPLFLSTEDNKTYLSTQSGIGVYDSNTDKFSTLFEAPYLTNDACIDCKGIFWLATTEGILRYNPVTKQHTHIQTDLFKEATSIIADRNGRIWIGTRQSLFIYSTQTKKFTILGETDGVLPNEYLFHAAMIDRTGNILMGGTAGMSIIHPSIRFNTASQQTIELLDVLLNGQPVPLKDDLQNGIDTIEIPWNFSSLQLKVLLNEKDVFRKSHFRFKIDGLNQRFANTASNSFSINYLPVGKYTITSSFYGQDTGWSAEQNLLLIIVTPPWWRTPWSYTLLILCIFTSVYFVNRYFTNKRKTAQAYEIEKIKNKSNEEKVTFLTNISHELRTPLTLICTPLKRIIDQNVHNEEENEQLTAIYRQAMQMNEIIDMALDVRKLEEGKEILHIKSYLLNEWIMEVAQKFMEEFKQKNIKLQFHLDNHIESVPFDKDKCNFVLSNFLMNALKFSESGTTTKISTQLSADGKQVSVSVSDQGIGLKGVDMNSLFTEFYQGFHDKGGSGIGLAYSKRLITLHKGNIHAMPNPGRGSTFRFELPLKQEEKQEKNNEEASAYLTYPDMKKTISFSTFSHLSILIVEDTPDLLNYMQKTMKEYFACTYIAKDGKRGLEQAMNKLPDIIVTDMMMPNMNGLELCHEIKQNLRISHIPVILLTAYSNQKNMYESYKTGADAFLSKPFDMNTLLALIANQINIREQIKARYQGQSEVLPTLQETSFSNADETFLLKLNKLINDNIANPEMDVSFLASNLCISRSLLYNKVKSLTGMSSIDYINQMRIEKAITLMKTSTLTLTEISEQTGFSTLRYFSKMFKNIKGIIPSEYKKGLDL
ncbi:response regulator [Bacteroides helcogenes]|uniref:hybrid sensor histidine kinase/response regulator transcription factor n=1 Tax=Bacteroides helcogenes TaxID=290053 RepID=UPI002A91ED6D|nr:response regulator [Bacteroides helcogenes]MDY5238154.1 response regulator [Bacteroides helcogenes]